MTLRGGCLRKIASQLTLNVMNAISFNRGHKPFGEMSAYQLAN
jgi:hypothetical protein